MKNSSAALRIALISLPIFIGALDVTVVSAVLPQVIYDLEIPLQSGLDDAAWLVSGYLLSYSIAMTFMGRLSDWAGRRRTYLAALIIFALGSYLVAVADQWLSRLAWQVVYLLTQTRVDPAQLSLNVMIAARMIQAFGGGAMVPVGMALAGDLYPPEKVARPLGLIAAVDTAGWVVGHLYGGVLTRFFDWRVIFWLNLPVCALAFGLIWIALKPVDRHGGGRGDLHTPPEKLNPGVSKGAARGFRMDWLGAFMISACLAFFNLGLGSSPDLTASLSDIQRQPWLERALPFLALALLSLALFIWRQSRHPFPLVPLTLFRQQNFSPALAANLMIGFSLFTAIAGVPVFVNTLAAKTLQQGAWDSGWLLSALTVPMAAASLPGGWLAAKLGYRFPSLLGLLLAVVGFSQMLTWQIATPYALMVPHLALAGIGFGLTMAPAAAAVLNASPPGERGAASALVIVFRLVGMTAGVSTLASYGVYRADALSLQWLSGSAQAVDLIHMGMQIALQVLHETFGIAALICGLAFFPIMLLQNIELKKG